MAYALIGYVDEDPLNNMVQALVALLAAVNAMILIYRLINKIIEGSV